MVLFLSWLFCVFCFFIPFKKRPQKAGHSKNPQNPKCRKKGQTKNSVSAVVFTNSVPNFLGVGYKNVIVCWKHYKNRGLSIFRERKKGQTLTKLLSWKSVQGWVENLSNYVAQHNWTDFRRKKMVIVYLFFFYFLERCHSPCRKKKILEKKQKQKKEQNLDRFSTQKRAIFGQASNSTIYIYIYIWRRPRFLPTFLAFCRQKQHILAILRQKRGKGRSKKEDQIGRAFFGRKVHFFPSFKHIFA